MFKFIIGAVFGAVVITTYPDLSEFFVDSGFKDYLVNGAIETLEKVK